MGKPEMILFLPPDGDRSRVTVKAIEGAPQKALQRAAALVMALDGVKLEDAPKALQSTLTWLTNCGGRPTRHI